MSDDSTVATVHRTHVGEQFLIVPNATCRGQLPIPLKVMARCILLHLLSLPEGWRMDRAQLDRGFVEGESAIDTGLKELKRHGYLKQTKRKSESGTWVWTWNVTDDPINHPLDDHPRKTTGWREQGKGEFPQVAPSGGIPPLDRPPILEHGYKNTDQKTDPLVLGKEQGVEPLLASVAVATSVSAPSDGAHLSPAQRHELQVEEWRQAGELCESCQYRRIPHRREAACR